MLDQIKGLHHVTSMAKDARRNNRFFTDTLGLRRVKKTVNFDAPDVYHLYYADEFGTPGSVMTYFPFPNIGKGRPGTGEVGTTTFAVPDGSLGFWANRLAEGGATGVERTERFGEQRLAFHGPDGDGFALVEARDDDRAPWSKGGVEADEAIRGFHSVSMRLADGGRTGELLKFMGYDEVESSGNITRFAVKEGNGAKLDRHRDLARNTARRPWRRLGASRGVRRREPRQAIGGAQGADGYRLPGDAGDRPRLFLGHLFPDAGRACCSKWRPTNPASTGTRTPRISARR